MDKTNIGFRLWTALLPGYEGRWVNDPKDRGGETMCGVTIGTWHTYSQKLFGIKASSETLKAITHEQWQAIAWEYYRALGCQTLTNEPLAVNIADTVWGSGAYYATKILQRACIANGAALVVDGAFGPKTAMALANLDAGSGVSAVQNFALRRWEYLEDVMRLDPVQEHHRHGWKRRVTEVGTIRQNGTGWIYTTYGKNKPIKI